MRPDCFAIAISLIAVVAPARPIPFKATGQWSIERGASSCALSRDFTSRGTKATLVISPATLAPSVEIAVMMTGDHDQSSVVGGSRQVQAGNKTLTVDFATVRAPDANQRIAKIWLKREDFAQLMRSPVTLPVTEQRSVAFSIPDFPAALMAADRCAAGIRKSWGIDPDDKEPVAIKATPLGVSEWIKSDDYPIAAITEKLEGVSYTAWVISEDGSITHCHTFRSSGFDILDEAACSAITARGRYQPARTSSGRAIKSISWRSTRWLMPDSQE